MGGRHWVKGLYIGVLWQLETRPSGASESLEERTRLQLYPMLEKLFSVISIESNILPFQGLLPLWILPGVLGGGFPHG